MKSGVRASNGNPVPMRALGLILALVLLPWHLQARDHASLRSVDLQERLVGLLARQGGDHWKGIPPSTLEQAMRVSWRRGAGLPSSGRGGGHVRRLVFLDAHRVSQRWLSNAPRHLRCHAREHLHLQCRSVCPEAQGHRDGGWASQINAASRDLVPRCQKRGGCGQDIHKHYQWSAPSVR